MSTRFNRQQVPQTAGGLSPTHVAGESTRKGQFAEGDGTSLRSFGGNSAKKDRRFSSASAPQKEAAFTFGFGNTGMTGRS